MKTKLLLLVLLTTSLTIQAQRYEYTIIQNSAYNYSVAVIPDFNTTAPNPIVNDQNFTIMLPDGTSVDTGSFSGGIGTYSATTITGLDGTFAPGPGNDATVFNLVQDISLPAHVIGTPIILTTFDILGDPITGSIALLQDGLLVDASGQTFASYFIVTLSGNLMDSAVDTYNDPLDGYNDGLETATPSYSFSTLSTPTVELVGVSIFPNPATDVVNIKGLKNDLKSIEVYNIAGQKVITATNNLETINVSELESGVYFLNLYTENASKTIKFIKQK